MPVSPGMPSIHRLGWKLARWMPPTWSARSMTKGSRPKLSSALAQDMPAGPAPMTATLMAPERCSCPVGTRLEMHHAAHDLGIGKLIDGAVLQHGLVDQQGHVGRQLGRLVEHLGQAAHAAAL